MALSLAFVLFMPKKIVSLMAFSSALVQANLHLFAIFTTCAWNSPEFIEPCLAKCKSSTANNGLGLGASNDSNSVK